MELPPVLRLLLSEIPPSALRDPKLFRRAVNDKGLLRDLKSQADYSILQYPYPDSIRDKADGLSAFFGANALNPFSPHGKCESFACRQKNAGAIATLATIYTDYLAVPDEFAQMFASREGALSSAERVELITMLLFYHQLKPLIDNGIIRFTNPPGWTCVTCATKAHPEIARIVDVFWEQFLVSGRAEVYAGPGTPHLEFSSELTDGLVITHELDRNEATRLRKRLVQPGTDEVRREMLPAFEGIVKGEYSRDVFLALEHAAIAAQRHLSGATTSMLDAMTLQAASKNVIGSRDVERWKALRRLDLPWVQDLSAEQLLLLREKAIGALPVFREKIASDLSSRAESQDSDAELEPILRGLRLQAEEVRSELASINLPEARALSYAAAGSTIALTVVGVGSQNPITAAMAVGLLGLLGMLHQTGKAQEGEHSRALTKPGYVLLAAQEILRHAHESEPL